MSKNILFTGTSVRADLLKPLSAAGYKIDNPTHLLTENELASALADASGYLLGGDEFASKAALTAGKDLKVVAFLGMGYQSFIDVAAAKSAGVVVTNTPGTLSNAVAEFTIGLLLNGTRRIYFYANKYAQGETGNEEKQRDLAKLRIGIVGLGEIGTRIAEILRRGFGCAVSYYSRTRREAEEKRLICYILH
jgi:glyoxylate reductase